MTDITLDNKGVKLAVSVHGQTDSEPILFLHGMSLSRDTWEEIAERLKNRHRVWTLDFRGHGHSDRASSYELADYVSDAETVLAAIERPAVIVGHSLGGCVAGVLAHSGHANVRAAFLEDPPWYLGEPSEWEKSTFPKLFSIISSRQAAWQQERAPLKAYLASFQLSNADGRDWQRSFRLPPFIKSCFGATATRRALLGKWSGLRSCSHFDRAKIFVPGQDYSSRSQIWGCFVGGP